VVLLESSSETAPYVTVSYCWGAGATLKTTRTNLEKHTREISLAAFPETLRDVILFARGLGFRYVWIDAVCIIQGDDLDWAEQASNMTAIYNGCALNIAVADAPNSGAGVVRKLRDCSVRLGTVSDPLPESGDGAGQCGIRADIYAVSAPIKRYEFPHEVARLATRGWVFQETLVSVASVYVTHRGLVWDCCTEMCHVGEKPQSPEGFGYPVAGMTMKGTWARDNDGWAGRRRVMRRLRFHGDDDDGSIERLRMLYDWVVKVSHRQLSESRDKLPCLAGLVSRLARVTSASYLAGLWKEDLAVGLTWHAARPGTLIRHADRAPSWSWASVDGPVSYLRFLRPGSKYLTHVRPVEGLDLEIIDAQVDEVHTGSFGEVRSGRIVVRGMIWPVTLRGKADKASIDSPFRYKLRFAADEAPDWGEGSALWILRIVEIYARGASTKHGGPHILFLVVEESGAGADEFRRVGFVGIDMSR
jgi:hypothetical protein